MEIGIDLGATKIEYVVLNDNNSELLRQRKKRLKKIKKKVKVFRLVKKQLSLRML